MLLEDRRLKQILPKIVSPYDENLVGPLSLDVRLSDQFLKVVFLDVMNIDDYTFDIREPGTKLHWKPLKLKSIELEPGEFILGSTIETFTLPEEIYADIKGKSTIARLGIGIEQAGYIDPGFCGTITLEIKNNMPYRQKLYAGQLIGQVRFGLCDTPEQPYSSMKHSYQNQSGPTKANLSKLQKSVEDYQK